MWPFFLGILKMLQSFIKKTVCDNEITLNQVTDALIELVTVYPGVSNRGLLTMPTDNNVYNYINNDDFLKQVNNCNHYLKISKAVSGITKKCTDRSSFSDGLVDETNKYLPLINIPSNADLVAMFIAVKLNPDLHFHLMRNGNPIPRINIASSNKREMKSIFSVLLKSTIPSHIQGLWIGDGPKIRSLAKTIDTVESIECILYSYFCRSLITFETEKHNSYRGVYFPHCNFNRYCSAFLAVNCEKVFKGFSLENIDIVLKKYHAEKNESLKKGSSYWLPEFKNKSY